MSLAEHVGNLFDSNAEAIGHGVNCKGLMGKGIALEFRRRWPAMYDEYKLMCQEGLLKPGFIYPYQTESGLVVVNIASQEYPGPDAMYEWVDSGVRNALAYCRERGYESLAIPRIGCGIGGLEWETVLNALTVAAAAYPEVALEVWSL